MAIDTTDVRSNANVQIRHAVEVIGRSENRRKVFEEIYKGKSKGKTAEQIAAKIGIDAIRVLQEALVLHKARLIGRQKVNGRLVYIKDELFSLYKEKILRQVINELARKKFEAKTNSVSRTNEGGVPPTRKTKSKASIKRKSRTIKILFLAANPKSTVSLRLDEEVREIEHKIMLAQKKTNWF